MRGMAHGDGNMQGENHSTDHGCQKVENRKVPRWITVRWTETGAYSRFDSDHSSPKHPEMGSIFVRAG